MASAIDSSTLAGMYALAFSTNAFKKNTLEEALQSIGGIGYPGVELMADLPHAYPPMFDPARRTSARRWLAEHGMRVSNINAFTLFAQGDTYHPTWIEADESRRQFRIRHTLDCIDLAAEFGAPTVSLQPGGPLIGTGLDEDQGAERFARGIEAVLPAARLAGITLAIEPEPGLLIETSAEYLAFKRRFFADEPRVRMNCDIGHLYCVGEDPAEVIRRMPLEIAHVHLEDIGANRVHQHLCPGQGAIDFSAVFDAVSRFDAFLWVTVELYPYETTAEGVARRAWEALKPWRMPPAAA